MFQIVRSWLWSTKPVRLEYFAFKSNLILNVGEVWWNNKWTGTKVSAIKHERQLRLQLYNLISHAFREETWCKYLPVPWDLKTQPFLAFMCKIKFCATFCDFSWICRLNAVNYLMTLHFKLVTCGFWQRR